MAPPVAATTSTPATATSHVSSAKPIPITPYCRAEVAIVCGSQIADQTPTASMPMVDSTATGASRLKLSRRPSSRYGVNSQSSVASASDPTISIVPLRLPRIHGRTTERMHSTTSHTMPHLVLRRPRVGRPKASS
jgi:hypothetical protein